MSSFSISLGTRPSSSPLNWIAQHKQESIATSIALVAIGALTVGLLALLSAKHVLPVGVGALSHLPVPVSSFLIGVSALGIIGLAFWKIQSYGRDVLDYRELIPLQGNRGYLEKQIQDPLARAEDTLNIANLEERLEENYNDKRGNVYLALNYETTRKLFRSYSTRVETDSEIEAAARMLLLTDQEILDLKIEEVDQYDCQLLELFLGFRLGFLQKEKKMVFETRKVDDKAEAQVQILTITDLLSIDGEDFLNSKIQLLNLSLLGLLSNQQKTKILASSNTIDQKLFDALLPYRLYNRYGVKYSYSTGQFLASLPMDLISKHIVYFSGAHLRCLPVEHLSSPDFPWDLVVKSKKQVEELFELGRWELYTGIILQSLNMEALKTLVPALRGKHLRLLSSDQLKNPEFPWALVVKSKKQVEELCELGWREFDTRKKLHSLNMEALKTLVPALRGKHLLLLSIDQLSHPEFPWDLVVKSKKQVEQLFKLGRRELYTGIILQSLNMEALKTLVPVLNGKHLRLLSIDQLRNPEFPWDLVVKSKKKVELLFSLDLDHGWEETHRLLNFLELKTLKPMFGSGFLTKKHLEYLTDQHKKSELSNLKKEKK